MFKDDGTVIHFNNPKVQASVPANTFAITGQSETKRIPDMMPGILNQLRPENLTRLNNLISGGQSNNVADLLAAAAAAQQQHSGGDGVESASNGPGTIVEENAEDDDDVPELVQNFDEAAKINEN